MTKPRSIFLLEQERFSRVYSTDTINEIQALTDNNGTIYTAQQILDSPELFADTQIIFSGWGAPTLDATLLNALPDLKAIFYAAGTVRYMITDEFWERDILLTSAFKTNAIPVAEFTMASIIFSLKKAFTHNHLLRAGTNSRLTTKVPGVYFGSRVGIVSLGAIGQLVCEKLSTLDIDIVAFDPYASDAVFERCGAKRMDDLTTLFASCDVVSIHAPWLPQTEGMITESLLRSMPQEATLINTSRGAVIDEAGLLRVLTDRPDLFAHIDVITDETDYSTHSLARMPNAFLTPHLAGSHGLECHRMGAMALQECQNFLNDIAPITPVTHKNFQLMA